ncbi:MAG TPA: hypothetical protein VLF90_03055 [Patescibacteria group bacterium]|nr:hypothetical protein [Patescibacteria group bacterium]
MAIICPTVTATNEKEYAEQLHKVVPLSSRLHLDFTDGKFAPTQSPPLDKAWWPAGINVDLHIMYKQPQEYLKTIFKLMPRLVIVHAEAEGSFYNLAEQLKAHGIKVGLALLKQTAVTQIESVLADLDHVLIFSGDLGHFGGTVNLGLLDKVRDIKNANPKIEIGWDGGINDRNAASLIKGGVDVLNVGGYIHNAANPVHAYATLKEIAQKSKQMP